MDTIAGSIIYGPSGQVLSNSGYGDAGASRKKRALKAFNAVSSGAQLDIDPHNSTLRQRSRVLYMASPIATSAIRNNRTNVIGCGLRLKPSLKRELLGMDADQATRMEKQIEAEFNIWARNKRNCDATGVNDFYAMQQLIFMTWLLSGDAFVLFKSGEQSNMHPYSLRLHVLEGDRISTPPQRDRGRRPAVAMIDGVPLSNLLSMTEGRTAKGNRIHDGVEVDKNGAIIAYHVCSDYPVGRLNFDEPPTWERVTAYGEVTGRPNILQIMDSERPEQYRGVPYLAHVIEPLLQTRRYTESELMAAVVESFFTAFVKTNAADLDPMGEAGPSQSADESDYEMGPGLINYLRPGEEVQFADPKRPTSGFATFTRAMAEQMGAALEQPADLLLKSFNSSYSASRAALLEAWKAFRMRREWFVSDFCRPTYEEWFAEAVAMGRINAPGFFTDPLIQSAWVGSEWIGPTQGQLDPVKEITAKVIAIREAITTREQATVELDGGSWDDNIEQIALENARLAEANAPLQLATTQPQPQQPQNKEDLTATRGDDGIDIQAIMRQVIKESFEEEMQDAKGEK